jgi:hypothetical protein
MYVSTHILISELHSLRGSVIYKYHAPLKEPGPLRKAWLEMLRPEEQGKPAT